ncbi:unnamed protein product [Peniophora sp. CBMAI 1063]|nr:unnamed protein product [Peniophora sp. CBMAI 1063]
MPSSTARRRSHSRSHSRSRSPTPAGNDGFGANMGREELVQNGRQLEKNYDKLEDQLAEVRKENAHLKAQRGRRKGRSRKERAAPPEPEEDIGEDAAAELRVQGKHAAQKFLLRCTLFLATGFSTKIERKRDYDLSPANRFINSEGVLQGQLRDVEDIVKAMDIADEERKSAIFWSTVSYSVLQRLKPN